MIDLRPARGPHELTCTAMDFSLTFPDRKHCRTRRPRPHCCRASYLRWRVYDGRRRHDDRSLVVGTALEPARKCGAAGGKASSDDSHRCPTERTGASRLKRVPGDDEIEKEGPGTICLYLLSIPQQFHPGSPSRIRPSTPRALQLRARHEVCSCFHDLRRRIEAGKLASIIVHGTFKAGSSDVD